MLQSDPAYLEKAVIEILKNYESPQEFQKLLSGGETEQSINELMQYITPHKRWTVKEFRNLKNLNNYNGLNDFLTELQTEESSDGLMAFKGISKTDNPISIAMRNSDIPFEWHKKKIALTDLDNDIDMSKDTRRIWMDFFFAKQLNENDKPKYHLRKKINLAEYAEIWKKFIEVDISSFDLKYEQKMFYLKNDWVVSKSFLKNEYGKRSNDIQQALLATVDQKDYPQEWPQKIPNCDKFPYSVALFIARELSL